MTNGVFVHSGCVSDYTHRLNGRIFPCPQCKETGKVNHPTQLVTKEVPLEKGEEPVCAYNGCWGCGFCRSRTKTIKVPVKIDCTLCDGYGRLKTKPKPITATVGWTL